MQLAELVAASNRVAATSSRSAKVQALAECLKCLAPEEVPIGVAFLSGEPRQKKLGIGPAALRQALGPSAPSPTLTLTDVDRALAGIAGLSGPSSAAKRSERLRTLLRQVTGDEQAFLLRLLAGELRQGALEGVMMDAVAQAAGLPPAGVRRAAMLAGDLGAVAVAALVQGAAGLERFSLRLFHPVLPMLAGSAEDAGDALAQLGQAALEWKLDGARVQVHKQGADVAVFTRRLNEVTGSVPEVAEAVATLPARELILDGEAIALRRDGTPEPFQVTMRRFGRKLDVAAMRRQLPLSVFFFDCLYLDGESLLDQPARSRFEALAKAVSAGLVVPRIITNDLSEAQAFFDAAVARGHEGVMAKALDAPYAAGSRGAAWLKVKRAHTLDLVVIAAEWGHGRRRGWLSNLHLAARDPEADTFVMLGKTFKGLSDEMLRWQTEKLLALELSRDDWTVYVKPELVVEIECNEVQASPQYPAGMALRFARVKRLRPDKRPEEADTVETVRRLFARALAAGSTTA
ncbi:MAG: ATP-dependent DNA ligase [Pseudomonadota bacterium]